MLLSFRRSLNNLSLKLIYLFLVKCALRKGKNTIFKIGLSFYLKIFAEIMKRCHIFHNLQKFVFLTVFWGSPSNFSLKKLYHMAYSLILKNDLNCPKWDKTLHGRSNTVLQCLICLKMRFSGPKIALPWWKSWSVV